MSVPLHLILLAGGQGLRAGGADDVPKQFRPTGQGALFAVSLREFQKTQSDAVWYLASLTVTAPEAWHKLVASELGDCAVPWQLAAPGSTRTASTWSAVQALSAAITPGPADLVAVHDAARPFATVRLLDVLAVAALTEGGAIPGVPLADTVVQTVGVASHYLQRESLVAVQTPQVFKWSAFNNAHDWAHEAGKTFTDDGGLLDARGQASVVVPGEVSNWKVTTTADWNRAKDILD